MADLLQLKQRLSNINSVYEITEAMQIITTILIGRAQKLLFYRRKVQPYFDRLFFTRHIDQIAAHESGTKSWVIAFFSERGFCGNYNHQLLHYLINYKTHPNLIIVGKKGKIFCDRLKIKYRHFIPAPTNIPHESIINPIYEALKEDAFPWNTKILINKYNNMFQQVPGEINLFPKHEDVYKSLEALTDLDQGVLDHVILEKYVRDRLFYFFIQNFTGETAAKLLMMKNAVESAETLQQEVSKEITKTRQSKITQDLSEVISAYKVLQQSGR